MNTKQLKQKILSLAITGRLVPQEPTDEPASELLKRIAPKATPLETDEPLPQGWCACKMGELIDIVSGVSYEKGDVTSDGIRILRGGNIQDGKILTYPDDVFLGTKYRNSTNSVRKGDIVMVASTGSFIALGKTGYCREDMENTQIGAFLRIIRAKEKSLSPLLNSFFSSDAFKTLIRKSAKGTSINNIKNGYITEIVFPLPPLAEQKRIAEAVERWFAKIDQLEHDCETLSKFSKQVREKLLSAAIAGRLVPQDPSDEPASELLKKIREEKARLVKEGKLKKDKNETVIFRGDDKKFYEQKGKNVTCIDDQIPFEIPDNWAWCKLGDIFSHCSGKALNKSNNKGTLRPYITTSNLYWNHFVLDNLRQMPFTKEELDKCTAVKGDLLVCEGGDVGRAAIWNYDEPICLQNHIHKLRAYVPLCTLFFYNVLYLYKHTGRIGGKGIALLGLSSRALHNIIIPLPPLAEQKRIVAKLESMFAVLDNLDALTA